MHIVTDPKEFQRLCWDWRGQGLRSALVPTMGYLHQGHVSLLSWGRANADRLAASIFVNPTQFGPNEDLDRYPRDARGDADKARDAGVDLLFMPEPGAMYPPGFATSVSVSGLTAGLCGASRPGHFDGVAVVVLKLLMLAMPGVAVFGQKDWQQLAMIRRMVLDLDVPVRIEGRPIFRESDGLAMSSRNVFLTPEHRAQAPAIHQGLLLARQWAAQGESSAQALLARLREHFARAMPGAVTDYASVVHPETIEPLEELGGPALLAVAVKFPEARLIDNMLLA